MPCSAKSVPKFRVLSFLICTPRRLISLPAVSDLKMWSLLLPLFASPRSSASDSGLMRSICDFVHILSRCKRIPVAAILGAVCSGLRRFLVLAQQVPPHPLPSSCPSVPVTGTPVTSVVAFLKKDVGPLLPKLVLSPEVSSLARTPWHLR